MYPNKYYIKRMDGIFFQEELKERNYLLNKSACDANCVVFISKFSQDSFHGLYPDLKIKKEVVINNFTNPFIFKKNNIKTLKKEYLKKNALIIATNWNRLEKRLNDILKLKEMLKKYKIKLHIIGKLEENIGNLLNDISYESYGYLESKEKINDIYNKCDFLINFSYKDACPKTVCNAINCGLPIYYANSGGLSEIVTEEFGYGIKDNLEIVFEKSIPFLSKKEIEDGFEYFLSNFEKYKNNLNNYLLNKENIQDYNKMLNSYRNIFIK
jgi:glycosyltransferase involved in cell wall biosynthesis